MSLDWRKMMGRVTIPRKSFPRKALYKQLETVYMHLVSAQISTKHKRTLLIYFVGGDAVVRLLRPHFATEMYRCKNLRQSQLKAQQFLSNSVTLLTEVIRALDRSSQAHLPFIIIIKTLITPWIIKTNRYTVIGKAQMDHTFSKCLIQPQFRHIEDTNKNKRH